MMTVIRVQQVAGDDPMRAVLSFERGTEYPIQVRDPFSEQQEQELAWYYEEHLRLPFLETVRARQAAESIKAYGSHLFTQIFADPRALAQYLSCVQQEGVQRLRFEIAGSPAFHRLHWEALYDAELNIVLALESPMQRQNIGMQRLPAQVRAATTINILLVTARPYSTRDVAYRTISRVLVEDELRQARLPITIDLVRPGTYEALSKHLESATQEHGPGYYHIVHFDVHGGLLTYEQAEAAQPQASAYTYNPYGRQSLRAYEGTRAFLLFEALAETGQEQQADLVAAQDLADLLFKHQIPMAILNACQSGKQDASESSVGSRLIEAGVQAVLAMGYSVTVSAAALFMRTLYQELFAARTLSEAVCAARRELYNRKGRRAYFQQTLDLEDWLLPVLYQHQEVQLQPRQRSLQETERYYLQQQARYQPPSTAYGFLGRDLDILQIEQRLLTRHNQLLIRGMGGAGKTTLLHHLGSWWQRTGLVEQVFYFGYDEKAWTRQQLVTTMARMLLGKERYRLEFQPLKQEAQQTGLAELLREQRHLLILDNLESITGTPLSIPHTLTKKEQNHLHTLLRDLTGGKTLVLLGSRSDEAWLAQGTFGSNVYELGGLDPEAASDLADAILTRYQVTHYRKDPALRRLLKLLDGFPLALEVVLTNLARQTPEQVLTALQAGDVALHTGDSQQKTGNILRCIDYSHSMLSGDARRLLTCLAPFTSVIYMELLPQYSEALKQQPLLATLPFERWHEILQEAINWGLLTPDAEIPAFLRIQPVFPFFLRQRLNKPEQAETKEAIERAFYDFYSWWGDVLNKFMRSKLPEERKTGLRIMRLEYENLAHALSFALEQHCAALALFLPLWFYLYTLQDQQAALDLAQQVLVHLEPEGQAYGADQQGKERCIVLDRVALGYFQLKRYDASQRYYEEALGISQEYGDRYNQASTYHQLGRVAEEQRKWEEAQRYYEEALGIKQEYGDRYNQARTYHQLGRLAYEQARKEEAVNYFAQARQRYQEYDEWYWLARTQYWLGRLAREQGQWEEAREHLVAGLQGLVVHGDGDVQFLLVQLARLWQESADARVMNEVVPLLQQLMGTDVQVTPEGVVGVFTQLLGEEKEENEEREADVQDEEGEE